MMFDRTPGDFAEPRPAAPDMCGYTNWLPGLENETNGNSYSILKQNTEVKKQTCFFFHAGMGECPAGHAIPVKKIRRDAAAAGTEAAIDLLQAENKNSPRENWF
ncbi:MAG: hypothetical protein IPI88_10850 [Chitinophagaceae bacterium]|nr:hypothetical protein [Chitinophagaceae bacterium]